MGGAEGRVAFSVSVSDESKSSVSVEDESESSVSVVDESESSSLLVSSGGNWEAAFGFHTGLLLLFIANALSQVDRSAASMD
jgi:hypothetical protein